MWGTLRAVRISSSSLMAPPSPSLSPTSRAKAFSRFRLPMYWSAIASGALADQRAITEGWTTPPLVGRSRNRGGFLGLGDQAAEARVSWVPNSALAMSSSVFTASDLDGSLRRLGGGRCQAAGAQGIDSGVYSRPFHGDPDRA